MLGVLAIGTLIDYELIKGFKIAGELNALSLIAILTTVVAVSRGMLQDDYAIYDPEWTLKNVIQHTHYMPGHWENQLHSDNVGSLPPASSPSQLTRVGETRIYATLCDEGDNIY